MEQPEIDQVVASYAESLIACSKANGLSTEGGREESPSAAWAAFLCFAATSSPRRWNVVQDYLQVEGHRREITCSRIIEIDQDEDLPFAIRVALVLEVSAAFQGRIPSFGLEGPAGHDGGVHHPDDPSDPKACASFLKLVSRFEDAALSQLAAATVAVRIEAHEL